ncbi:MAG TPA: class II aldolase/adducin family protein [Kouleothrix sp.]|nr:class II aldolase/adducin family protein [Kouleothrix sp.]
MLLEELRRQVFAYARQMAADGLAHGSQGNISALDAASGLVAITPSAADYATMTAEDIVVVDRDGAVVEGRWKPTIETPLHTLFYRRRPDVGAVIHCHAPYASGFAAALRPIPLVLAEAAACLGQPVPVAPFMPSGTPQFAELMLATIGSGLAAVMGQHGIVACGADLRRAYASTVAVEDSARAYIFGCQLGAAPAALPPEVCAELHGWWLNSYRRVAL